MSAPLVSIVIATYRSRHDHLRVAIDSALAQSMADIEVIVSDDSPDDALSEWVAGFHDERLRYRHNAPALGVARNHWVSFGEARGEFIVILNHDDWLAPAFVERLASALQAEPQAVLAFCDHWVIDNEGERLTADTERNTAAWGRAQLSPGLHRSFAPLVAAQTIPMAMGAMFRRAALPALLPDDAGPAYDLWLTYLMCRAGAAAWYESERLSAWRAHAGNLTSEGGLEWLHGTAICWAAMARDANFVALRQVARRRAADSFNGCATRSWAHGQRAGCVRYAWRSLKCTPTAKAVAAMLMTLLPTRCAPQRWARGAAIVRHRS
jgi:glycosyltransferase involved in cell wall biosynthesis